MAFKDVRLGTMHARISHIFQESKSLAENASSSMPRYGSKHGLHGGLQRHQAHAEYSERTGLLLGQLHRCQAGHSPRCSDIPSSRIEVLERGVRHLCTSACGVVAACCLPLIAPLVLRSMRYAA